MAGRIQGITVEIGGDTTKLQTALKGVNSEIKNTQSQLKDVEKLLKLDPGNTELLAQKHRLLGDAVKETKEKLETLKTAAEQANDALARGDISQEQYDALQREIVETENALKDLESQAGKSEVAIQKIADAGEKMKTLGDNISGVGEKFLPVTAAVTGLGTVAVKTAADFDSGMSKVAAISGATGEDLDALREKAREMGSKTKFSASEAASAMEYMAMAGWKTEDMLGGIEGIMNLAAASGEDLATTSDIVTDALTAFGLTAADSGHFADVLAAASSNANTNVSMMGETFKYAAPIAGALGFSVEDTATAIGLMANAGIKGSQAGTALRSIMNNLAGEVKFCGEELGEVTIQTTNADGSMRDLSDILADCRGAFSQLSESEQAAAAESLVGKNAMSGFLAIMNAGEADVNKLSDAIAGCDGTSQSMADTMQDNLAGQMTILKSQLEELAISFGEMLMPVIRDVVGWIQGFVDTLNSMDEGTRKTIITIAAIVAAIGPVLIIVGKVISAVGTILTIIPKISAAINAVKGVFAGLNAVMAANPIFLIIAAIAALVAAFIYLWNNCEEFRQFWIDLWEGIKEIAVTVWNAIKDFFVGLWEGIKAGAEAIWNAIRDFFVGLWEGIKSIAETVWNAISGFFTGLWNGIKSTAESVWNAISGFFTGLWNGIKSTAESIWNGVSGFFSGLWDGIKNTAKSAWDGISSGLSSAWEGIKGTVSKVWNGISDTVSTVTDAVGSTLQDKWDDIKGAYEEHGGGLEGVAAGAMEAIKGYYTAGWEAVDKVTGGKLTEVKDKVVEVWDSVKSWLSSTWESMKQTADTVWTAVSDFFTGIWDTIQTTFNTVVTAIADFLSSTWESIQNTISSVMNAILGTISSGWNSISSTVSSIVSGISSTVTTTWETIKTSVSTTVDSIKTAVGNAFTSMWNGITSTITNIYNSIVDGFNKAVNWIKGLIDDAWNWGADLIGNIVDGIRSCIDWVADAASDVADAISSFLHFSVPDEGPLSEFESWMPDFMQGLARGIEKSRGLVKDAIGDVAADMTISPRLAALEGAGAGGKSTVNHTGTIRVEGVTDSGMLSGVVDIVIDQLRQEVRL